MDRSIRATARRSSSWVPPKGCTESFPKLLRPQERTNFHHPSSLQKLGRHPRTSTHPRRPQWVGTSRGWDQRLLGSRNPSGGTGAHRPPRPTSQRTQRRHRAAGDRRAASEPRPRLPSPGRWLLLKRGKNEAELARATRGDQLGRMKSFGVLIV